MPDNYGEPRWQFATSQQSGRCASRSLSNCATAIKAEGIGEPELIQGELDAVQADLRPDLAYAELRNSYEQVFASARLNLLLSTLPSNELGQAAMRGLAGEDSSRWLANSWYSAFSA
ncbi:hypothetical protein [Pseudomonas sp. R32]|uniref:hypothetical protein n=1 Tax=Pseudomonas sp. R32 TaxID=1573704 RepID=UPI001E484224|nr:hypothetical protein [Pseudomonas sp. R32]